MAKQPVIIAGLGNPGKEYERTPHNAGFLVVEALAKACEFGPFAMEIDGLLTAQKELDGTPVILAKPQTFMNNSGRELAKLLQCQKLSRKKSYPNLWIVNDDIDLPLGKIKIVKNRGSAGHKGVQSIIDRLKTKNFIRFRVGVQKSGVANGKIPADKFVLKKFPKTDETVLENAIQRTANAIRVALNEGLEKSMTRFNA
jgi:PTH1 family peptidyl-tRNA hydrolase